MRPFGTLAAALGATLLFTLPAEAEDPWRVGFRVGLSFPDVEVSGQGNDTSGESSFAGGVLIERRLWKGISLESGLIAVQRRWVLQSLVSFGTADPPETGLVRFRSANDSWYLELPLLLKATFGTAGLQPWIAAGPTMEVLLSSQGETVVLDDGPGIEAGTSVSGSTAELYRDLVFGFELSTGLDYRVADRTSIHLDVRWAPGTSNLLRNAPPPGYTSDDRSVRSNDVRILAGVSFGL